MAYKTYKYKEYVFYIVASDQAITHITTDKSVIKSQILEDSSILLAAYKQLDEYFHQKRKIFDLPLAPTGTDFQLKVWKALCDISYGKVVSYKDIAEKIGNNKASRAIGNANNKNPIMIVIPCHRVIGSDGKLVGFGAGIDLKEHLLKLEKVY